MTTTRALPKLDFVEFYQQIVQPDALAFRELSEVYIPLGRRFGGGTRIVALAMTLRRQEAEEFVAERSVAARAQLSATGDRIVLWSSSRPTPVVWAQHADASTVLEHIAIFGAITAPTKLTIHAALADHNAIEAMLSSSDRGFALECALRRMSGLGY